MLATILHAPGRHTSRNVPDPSIVEPTDAIIHCRQPAYVARTCGPTVAWSLMQHEKVQPYESIKVGAVSSVMEVGKKGLFESP